MKKKNTKKILLGVGSVVLLLVVVATILIVKNWDLLKLKRTVNDLVNKDYEYAIDYEILTNVDIPIESLEALKHGTIKGKKCGSMGYGDIYINDEKYLDFYAEQGGSCLFNIKPVFDLVLDKVSGKLSKGLALLSLGMDDTYLSLEQIQEVLGDEDVTKMDSVALSKLAKDTKYKVEVLKEGTENYKKGDFEDAVFYKLTFPENELSIIMGVAKNRNIFLRTESKWVGIEAYGSYEPKELEAIEMPEKRVSDKIIKTLKEVFALR